MNLGLRQSFWAQRLEDLLLRLQLIYHALSGQAPLPFQRPSSRTRIKNKGIGVSDAFCLVVFCISHGLTLG